MKIWLYFNDHVFLHTFYTISTELDFSRKLNTNFQHLFNSICDVEMENGLDKLQMHSLILTERTVISCI